MKYKSYVANITKALIEYKGIIDKLETAYLQEKRELLNKAESMKGKWTEEYIAQYKKDNAPDDRCKQKMKTARAKYEPTILHYLELIKKQLDDYFNAPVKVDFANKINAIKISGLALNDREFQLMRDTATSYMELRLLNQLAESRTNMVEQHTYDITDPTSGRNGVNLVERPNPYSLLKVPDIDVIYNAFNAYKTAAKGLLYSYAGAGAELSAMLDDNTPNYIAVTMDSYFRNKQEEKFAAVMESANSILPESKVKRTLTENDKKLIDTLIGSNLHPILVKGRVEEIAASSPELAELLSLDERYKEYLETSTD